MGDNGLGWPSEQPTLGVQGLTLRPFRDGDIDAIFFACSDTELQRWLPVPEPWTHEAAASYVTDYAKAWWITGRGAVFAIVDSADVAIGSADLDQVNASARTGEVGYWLAPTARGRGLATSAVTALTHWALTEGGLNRIEFRVDPANIASVRVLGRLGAKREGVLRQVYRDRSGTFQDKAVYALLKDDLVSHRSPPRAGDPISPANEQAPSTTTGAAALTEPGKPDPAFE